ARRAQSRVRRLGGSADRASESLRRVPYSTGCLRALAQGAGALDGSSRIAPANLAPHRDAARPHAQSWNAILAPGAFRRGRDADHSRDRIHAHAGAGGDRAGRAAPRSAAEAPATAGASATAGRTCPAGPEPRAEHQFPDVAVELLEQLQPEV